MYPRFIQQLRISKHHFPSSKILSQNGQAYLMDSKATQATMWQGKFNEAVLVSSAEFVRLLSDWRRQRRTSNVERRTSNVECRTSNVERRHRRHHHPSSSAEADGEIGPDWQGQEVLRNLESVGFWYKDSVAVRGLCCTLRLWRQSLIGLDNRKVAELVQYKIKIIFMTKSTILDQSSLLGLMEPQYEKTSALTRIGALGLHLPISIL